MSDILITSHTTSPYSNHYFHLASEKREAFVTIGKTYVQVCVQNAQAKRQRLSMGKIFHGSPDATIPQAIEAYKSTDVKAMIRTAAAEAIPPQTT